MIPIRCFTCNKIIADKWNLYQNMNNNNLEIVKIFEKLEIKRYCCKRMFLTHSESTVYPELPSNVTLSKNYNKNISYKAR